MPSAVVGVVGWGRIQRLETSRGRPDLPQELGWGRDPRGYDALGGGGAWDDARSRPGAVSVGGGGGGGGAGDGVGVGVVGVGVRVGVVVGGGGVGIRVPPLILLVRHRELGWVRVRVLVLESARRIGCTAPTRGFPGTTTPTPTLPPTLAVSVPPAQVGLDRGLGGGGLRWVGVCGGRGVGDPGLGMVMARGMVVVRGIGITGRARAGWVSIRRAILRVRVHVRGRGRGRGGVRVGVRAIGEVRSEVVSIREGEREGGEAVEREGLRGRGQWVVGAGIAGELLLERGDLRLCCLELVRG